MQKMQKIFLLAVPMLLAASVPLYNWSREGVSFVIFGGALGAWIINLAIYIAERRNDGD
ncbi:MAG: hypothetical protein IJ520_03000 [Synergistaceae bacterium]|nr:hypothetical protein [Synergistaceae bacterium]